MRATIASIVLIVVLTCMASPAMPQDLEQGAYIPQRVPFVRVINGAFACTSRAWMEYTVTAALAKKPKAIVLAEIRLATRGRIVCRDMRRVVAWAWSARLISVHRSYMREAGIVRIFTPKGILYISIWREMNEA